MDDRVGTPPGTHLVPGKEGLSSSAAATTSLGSGTLLWEGDITAPSCTNSARQRVCKDEAPPPLLECWAERQVFHAATLLFCSFAHTED